MLILTQGLDLRQTRVPVLLALWVAEEVYERHGHPLRVTCLDRPLDQGNSLHRVGLAVDLGIRDPNGEVYPDDVLDSILEELRRFLQKPHGQYDVVDERDRVDPITGLPQPHIHIEHDPR